MENPDLLVLAARIGDRLRARGWTLAAAESCTAGLVAAALTDVAGSSDWFLGGVVAYANSAKTALLGVSGADLAASGAVSEPVVRAMAAGARRALGADAGLAVSGIAGPGGGTPDKPVGTVWMAWDLAGAASAARFRFPGGRAAVRAATVRACLEELARLLEAAP
ncbi:MAG: CinA family protein [Thermodesulfobacteriota bacterium]